MTDTFLTRRTALRLGLVSMAGLVSACTTTSVFDVGDSKAEDQTAAALPLTNAVRATHGLPPLSVNVEASRAALHQAARMAKAQKMSHLIGFRDSFYDRMKSSDVTLPAAENIATGQKDVAAAVDAWVHSPKHLKNMLGNYSGLGVAVAYDSSTKRPYWAMVLSN
ncbi:CAP domain-containing protein [Rhizobium halophytocola]|uniref:Uncharacterized protein YkwD n=1 Tax=Rhizobium halophytocola TaxID=735519 RepID=A0ABS4E099_9HYPH|nr:CAP domain-containing protein [Rhizobium halophytocola]MBP1851363.1 uncharacterized protein YkwD [Rhizobium halophytocola]